MAIAAPVLPRAPAAHRASLTSSTFVIARRGALKFLRTPQLVVVGTLQGAMFLLIFRYVFGGAISSGGLSYVNFLVPGFITSSVLFGGMGSASAVAEDLQAGFIDRLRSLPIPRSSVLTGRVLADMAMLVWSLIITTAIGFAVGFRLHGSVPAALGAFALCVAFGLAFDWLFIPAGHDDGQLGPGPHGGPGRDRGARPPGGLLRRPLPALGGRDGRGVRTPRRGPLPPGLRPGPRG